MRFKYLLIIPVVMLIACTKNNNSGGTGSTGNTGTGNPNPTPTTKYYEVPNWDSDTLVGLWTRSDFSIGSDTIFALNISGKSYVKYKGVQYHLQAYTLDGSALEPAASLYFIDVFDASNKVINKYIRSVTCKNYYDSSYNKWETQNQSILISEPPFSDSVVAGLYTTLYK